MSATERGVGSANGPATASQPSGFTFMRFARMATKIFDFSSP